MRELKWIAHRLVQEVFNVRLSEDHALLII